MAFRFKSMGYKMKPSSLRSPLKVGGPETSANNTKQTATTKMVESITEEEPRKTTSTIATDTSSEYNPTSLKTGEDPKTGYYNPFETLAKVILTPDTERAKQRVKERQEKRLAKVEKTGNTKKIERVKARQAEERKLRKIDK
jgi:hypothetical protein